MEHSLSIGIFEEQLFEGFRWHLMKQPNQVLDELLDALSIV